MSETCANNGGAPAELTFVLFWQLEACSTGSAGAPLTPAEGRKKAGFVRTATNREISSSAVDNRNVERAEGGRRIGSDRD